MNIEMSFVSQENFWSKMARLKYDICYYDLYFAKCVLISRVWKCITVGGTALATLLWMEFNHVAFLSKACPCIIFGLQALAVIKDWFPHDDRKKELRELVDELRPIYEDMEGDWQRIAIGHYSEHEIIEKATAYSQEIEKLRKHYFKDDALPEITKLVDKADAEVKQYYVSKGWC